MFVGNTLRAINVLGAGLVGINAVCMALLVVSALAWDGTPNAKRVGTAVILLQIVALCGTYLATLRKQKRCLATNHLHVFRARVFAVRGP